MLNSGGPMSSVDRSLAFAAPTCAAESAFCLVMAHETPGDPLARGLPSPVCTGRAERQSRRQQTV